jgi:hypothetical protein
MSLKPTHYAFIEDEIDFGDDVEDESIILDCITAKAADTLHDRSWGNIAERAEALQQTMLLAVSRGDFRRYVEELRTGDWVSFVLNSDDSKKKGESIRASFISLSGGSDGPALPEFRLTALKAASRRLPGLTYLTGLNATRDKIRRVLGGAGSRTRGHRSIAIYDVGQGNASALVDEYGHPCLFFDFGWPTSANRGSRPTDRPNLFACDKCYWDDGFSPPVILSHWDYDHWAYAVENTDYDFGVQAAKMTFHPEALDRWWITPRPPRPACGGKGLGPTHLRFIASLPKRLVWPNSLHRVPFCAGEVTRTDPKVAVRSRNNQALAWFVMETAAARRAILLPGDIHYRRLRWPKTVPGLVSLAVTHHGGKAGSPPQPVVGEPLQLVVAVGNPNTHGHPVAQAIADHQNQGWPSPLKTSTRKPIQPGGPSNGSILLSLPGAGAQPAVYCLCQVNGNLVPTQ